jgi:hypothetical protein
MTGFVSERDHVMHGTMKCHVDAFFTPETRSGAECAWPFAWARLGFDPAV